MNYAHTTNRPNPVALVGALGVPAAFGAVLIVGLAVTGSAPNVIPNIDTIFVDPVVPDPPPPPDTKQPTEVPQQHTATVRPPIRPDSPIDLGKNTPITTFPDPGPIPLGPIDLGGPIGTPSPNPVLPDPIGALPRNNPGRWVTDSDYRSRWVREGLSGVASFALTIDSNGRVNDCTITRSSGHAPLDAATCKLIERRARFDPAMDSYGNPVSGTYRSSVNWKLPE